MRHRLRHLAALIVVLTILLGFLPRSAAIADSMTAQGTVTGKLTDAVTGVALTNGWVQQVDPLTGESLGSSVLIDLSGSYTLANVTPGMTSLQAVSTGHATVSSTISVVAGQSTVLNFALPESGLITGLVTDASGTPVADVTFSASSATGHLIRFNNGPNGRYLVELPVGTYTLTANAAGFMFMAAQTVTISASQPLTKDITLETISSPGTVTGRVTDRTTGAAIANATVYASHWTDAGNILSAPARTALDGSFTITSLQPMTYFAFAAAPGYMSTNVSVTVLAGETTTADVQLQQAGTITGQITDASGTPLSGAFLSMVTGGSSYSSPPTQSNGSYSVTLPVGTYTVKAMAGGYVTSSAQTLTVAFNQTASVNFTLQSAGPTGSITGKVLDAVTGNAIPGASIRLLEPLTYMPVMPSSVSGFDGSYTLTSINPGSYSLEALVPSVDYISTAQPVTVVGGESQTHDLRVQHPGHINGRVTDSSGNAVAGATVEARGTTNFSLSSGTTQADGSYALTVSSADDFSVSVTAPGYVTAPPQKVTVTYGQAVTVNFTLMVAQVVGTLTGRVTDEAGTPMANATVTLRDGPTQTTFGSPVVTGSDGVFTFSNVPAGSYRLDADAGTQGYWGTSVGVIVSAGSTTVNLTTSRSGTVLIRLVDSKGGPVTGTGSLWLTSNNGIPGPTAMNLSPDGSFSESYVVGTYTVVVRVPGYLQPAPQTITVTPNATTTATFAMTAATAFGTVEGKVTDAPTGAPLVSATVSLVDPITYSTIGTPVQTGSDGSYSMANVIPGSYQVSVQATGYMGSNQNVSVSANQVATVNFTLSQYGNITGRVVDANNTPVNGAIVSVAGHDGGRTIYPVASDGTFSSSLIGLKAGSYTITVSALGYAPTTEPVTVIGNHTVNLTFTLIPSAETGSIAGTVIDGQTGNPVGNGQIYLMDMSSHAEIASVRAGLDGSYSFPKLAAGTYELFTNVANYMFNHPPTVSLATGQAATVNIQLTQAGSLAGKVVDVNGHPISTAWVSLGTHSISVSSDGSFTLDPISVGTHQVMASAPGYYVAQTVQIAFGQSTSTTLTLKTAATLALASLGQTYDGTSKNVGVTTNPAGLTNVNVTYNGSATPPTNAGSYTVVAGLTNATYGAPAVTDTLVIAKANQTITFAGLAAKTYGDAPITVSATASSGLPVTFATTGSCTNTGASITINGAGTCTVTASQAGDANRDLAVDVSQSFTIANATGAVTSVPVVAPTSQAISFGALGAKTYGDPSFAVSAVASSGLPVSFNASGNCSVSSSTITITGAGTCEVTASQAGGGNFAPAASVSQTFAITKSKATLSLGALDQYYDKTSKPVSVISAPSGLTGITITYDGVATPPVKPGSYAVIATLNNLNYELVTAFGTLVISNRTKEVKAADAPTLPSVFPTPIPVGSVPLTAPVVIEGTGTTSVSFTVTDDKLHGTMLAYYYDSKLNAWIAVPTTISANGATASLPTGVPVVLMYNPNMAQLKDMSSNWANDYVLKLQSLGIMGGYADGTFHPDQAVDRYQVAKVLATLNKFDLSKVDLSVLDQFADADQIPTWAKPYVAAVVQHGLMHGTGTDFGGPGEVTRAQIATLLGRLLGDPRTVGGTFSDEGSIPTWAQEGVAKAVAAGIISGFPDGSFGPDQPLTRAQLAKIIAQLVDKVSR